MSTPWTEPGYVEPDRSTGNRENTDYSENTEPEENDRYAVFRDRRRK